MTWTPPLGGGGGSIQNLSLKRFWGENLSLKLFLRDIMSLKSRVAGLDLLNWMLFRDTKVDS